MVKNYATDIQNTFSMKLWIEGFRIHNLHNMADLVWIGSNQAELFILSVENSHFTIVVRGVGAGWAIAHPLFLLLFFGKGHLPTHFCCQSECFSVLLTHS